MNQQPKSLYTLAVAKAMRAVVAWIESNCPTLSSETLFEVIERKGEIEISFSLGELPKSSSFEDICAHLGKIKQGGPRFVVDANTYEIRSVLIAR